MSQRGVFLGLCPRCGGNIRSGVKFCGNCGKQITADVLVPAPSADTDPLAPLVTKVIPRLEKRTRKQQLADARLSVVNPYGGWGKLICDDSKEKMWTPFYMWGPEDAVYYCTEDEDRGEMESERYLGRLKGNYGGNAFCCWSVGSAYQVNFISKYKYSISDFVYQVHVSGFSEDLYARVLFRCQKLNVMRQKWAILLDSVERVQTKNCQIDSPRGNYLYRVKLAVDTYYGLVISSGAKGEVFAELIVSLGGIQRTLERYNVSELCHDVSREGVLVGVVVVEGKIDLYVNLVHIGSVEDYSISSGNVGLGIDRDKKTAYSHAKVWSA